MLGNNRLKALPVWELQFGTMWAVATRVKAEKDILLVPGVKSAIIDPTSDPTSFTVTKMGIDATAPIDEAFAERLVISDEQRIRAKNILANAGIN